MLNTTKYISKEMKNMSNKYFATKLSKDDKAALEGLKKSQPGSNWDEAKYCEYMLPDVYNSYIQQKETKSIYFSALDMDDKKALEGLKHSQPQGNWTAEKYIQSMKPDKYEALKVEDDKASKLQGRYRDLVFYEKLDNQDKGFLKRMKIGNPDYSAEDFIKQYYEDSYYKELCNTLEAYSNGDLYYSSEEADAADDVEEVVYSSEDDDNSGYGNENEGDADAE
jgi:hypothetical protein